MSVIIERTLAPPFFAQILRAGATVSMNANSYALLVIDEDFGA